MMLPHTRNKFAASLSILELHNDGFDRAFPAANEHCTLKNEEIATKSNKDKMACHFTKKKQNASTKALPDFWNSSSINFVKFLKSLNVPMNSN